MHCRRRRACRSNRLKFGKRVRTLREARRFTQLELAKRVGVNVSYIGEVENKKRHFGDYPSEKFIHKLVVGQCRVY